MLHLSAFVWAVLVKSSYDTFCSSRDFRKVALKFLLDLVDLFRLYFIHLDFNPYWAFSSIEIPFWFNDLVAVIYFWASTSISRNVRIWILVMVWMKSSSRSLSCIVCIAQSPCSLGEGQPFEFHSWMVKQFVLLMNQRHQSWVVHLILWFRSCVTSWYLCNIPFREK